MSSFTVLAFIREAYVYCANVARVCDEVAGTESSWSVDGELMSNNNVSACVFRGLVDVFARGVETELPV